MMNPFRLISCWSAFLFFLQLSAIPLFAQDSLHIRQTAKVVTGIDQGTAIALRGNYAFLAVGRSGVVAINNEILSQPSQVGYCDTPGSANDVLVHGNYAYIADGYSGLRILDASNPAAMVEIGHYDTPGYAYKLAKDDSLVFVADGMSGVRIVDVGNPFHPYETGSCDTPDNAISLALRGQYLYVADHDSGLRILDVATPALPREVAHIDTLQIVLDITFIDTIGCITTIMQNEEANVDLFDCSNPVQPRWIRRLAHESIPIYYRLFFNGEFGYLADGSGGITVYDFHNPALPIELTSVYAHGFPRSFAFQGNYCFCVVVGYDGYDNNVNGLTIFDIASPAQPSLVGSFNRRSNAVQVTIRNNYAYLANSRGGLSIFNISNPDQPVEVGRSAANCYGLYFNGNYAYSLTQIPPSQVSVLDFSDPVSQVEVVSLNQPTISRAIVRDTLAIISSFYAIEIWNLSNPQNLSLVNRVLCPFYVKNFSISNNLIFVVGVYRSEILMYDVSNPQSPIQVGRIFDSDTSGFRNTCALDTLLFAVGDTDIKVYNVANPQQPELLSSFLYMDRFYTYVTCIKAAGNYLYIADNQTGIFIANIADPRHPSIIGFYETPGNVNDFAIAGDRVYVADGYNLGVYDCSQALGVVDRVSGNTPTDFGIEKIYPNPMNASTTVRYNLPNRSQVKMELFDITGRSAGTVMNWMQEPGVYSVKISSERLSSGMYFVKLTAGTQIVSTRLVVLK